MFPPGGASATLAAGDGLGGQLMMRIGRLGWAAVVGALLFAVGCEDKDASRNDGPEPPDPARANLPVEGKRVEMARNVWLEVLPNGARRVVMAAEVCLRQGML